MDLIPTWARTFWDAWTVRILVLLSFVLQVILSLFGNHRKHTTSLWISVLVWVAYLKADWVATIALSKISDAEGNKLWATWATLLLLHLGGTESITVYSLEDNQLWRRQLMGFVVQMFVAIYVIGISWNNSYRSFVSLLAFVAGIARYWGRTWVLRWVSGKKYIDTLPVDQLGDNFSTRRDNEYVHVLVVAHEHLKAFMKFLKHRGTDNEHQYVYNIDVNSRIMWDAVDVKMGLMYDLLYTKASRVYGKWGMMFRFFSFACTVIVVVALWDQLHVRKHGLWIHLAHTNFDKMDIAVTWVIMVGAAILEIYASSVMYLSNNWMMLRLIKAGRRHWVIWHFNKGKNWSNMMGQFDLLGYWLKVRETDVKGLSRKRISLVLGRIIRSVFGREYEEKWNIYQYKTAIPVRPLVYEEILDLWKPQSSYRRLFSQDDDDDHHDGQLRDIWNILDKSSTFDGAFQAKIMCLHLATTICCHRETETNDGSNSPWKRNMKVSKALSDYMMYLLIVNPSLYPLDGSDIFAMNPSLFPNDGSKTLEENIDYLDSLIGNTGEVSGACDHLLTHGLSDSSAWYGVVRSLVTNLEIINGNTGEVSGVVGSLVTSLKGINGQEKRWEIMKLMWWRMLQTAASDPKIGGIHQKDAHFQGLSQGGELLTFIWFYYSAYVKIKKRGDRTGNP